jgi:hypothetical protein
MAALFAQGRARLRLAAEPGLPYADGPASRSREALVN